MGAGLVVRSVVSRGVARGVFSGGDDGWVKGKREMIWFGMAFRRDDYDYGTARQVLALYRLATDG